VSSTPTQVPPTLTPTRTLEPPTSGLAWKVSQLAWTSGSLAGARAAVPPATISTDNGFVFPVGQASYSPATGAATVDFQGGGVIGNVNQGNFRITFADPSIIVAPGGAGQLVADVSYCLTTCSTTPVTVGPARVVITTFTVAPGVLTVTGNHVSGIVQLDYPLQNDSTQPTFRQFPSSFLNALDPGLQAFFKDTANAQGVPTPSNLQKPPAPIAIGFDFVPPSSTATATSLPLGGKALGISSGSGGVGLTWQSGQGQTGYVLARLTNNVVSVPAPNLPASATSFVDTTAPGGLNCYLLFSIGTSAAAQSDLECAAMGFHTPSGAPDNFTLRLNQSNTATLSWVAPPGVAFDSYLFVPFGGSPQVLPVGMTSVPVPIAGPTCFAVGLVNNGALLGYSDMLCGFPGASTLATGAGTGPSTGQLTPPTPTAVRRAF
jgi:hypothetical protein